MSPACRQLERFTVLAQRWLENESRLVGLCGTENLVLGRNCDVRHLDAFRVFFYLDVLDGMHEVGDALTFRIETSVRRLEYLERLVKAIH